MKNGCYINSSAHLKSLISNANDSTGNIHMQGKSSFENIILLWRKENEKSPCYVHSIKKKEYKSSKNFAMLLQA